jgi:hypothetical protein
VEIVKEVDGLQGDGEMATTAAIVAQGAPVLQTCDRVLDPGASSSMAFPGAIAADSVAVKDGCEELPDATIAAVGEDAPVLPA